MFRFLTPIILPVLFAVPAQEQKSRGDAAPEKTAEPALEIVYRGTLALAHALVVTKEGVSIEAKPVAKGSAVAFDYSAYWEEWQKARGAKEIRLRKKIASLSQDGRALYGPDNALTVDTLFGSSFPPLFAQGAALDTFRSLPRLQKGMVVKTASEEVNMPADRLAKDGTVLLVENTADRLREHLATVPLAARDPEKGQKVLVVGRDFDTARIVSVEGEWAGEGRVALAEGSIPPIDPILGAGVYVKQGDKYVLSGLVQKRGDKDLRVLSVSEIRKQLDTSLEKQ